MKMGWVPPIHVDIIIRRIIEAAVEEEVQDTAIVEEFLLQVAMRHLGLGLADTIKTITSKKYIF